MGTTPEKSTAVVRGSAFIGFDVLVVAGDDGGLYRARLVALKPMVLAVVLEVHWSGVVGAR